MSSDAGILTVRTAYLATFEFLRRHHSSGHSDEIGIILGGMALLPDGVSADPAMLRDFEESVKEVLRQESTDGYKAASFGAR